MVGKVCKELHLNPTQFIDHDVTDHCLMTSLTQFEAIVLAGPNYNSQLKTSFTALHYYNNEPIDMGSKCKILNFIMIKLQ